MENLFSQILNMSLTGSVVIILVLLARLALKRSPKIYSYLLWSVVLFRLLCPVSLAAPVSVLNLFQPRVTEASETTSVVQYLQYDRSSDFSFVAATSQQPPAHSAAVQAPVAAEGTSSGQLIAWIWVAGLAAMTLYSAVLCIRLRIRQDGAMLLQGNVYLADHIGSPFVMGILRPNIYLPSRISPQERTFIIAHEQHHIRRMDHITRILAYCALCIHWFNPLVWVCFILSGRDMEMSCDEAVIQKLGPHIRADYAAALLRLATHRKIIAGMPLAFGEGDTKGRVINMAKWKKPGLWVSIVCVLLCALVLVACAVNPRKEESLEDMTRTYGPASVGVGELFFTLPEGYSIEMQESQNQSGGNITQYEQAIKKDGIIIGGVVGYPAPEVSLSNSDSSEWISALGLWEATDESLGYMGGSSIYGDYEINYFSDVPPGEAITVDNFHTFFVTEDIVYDIWFDRLAADNQVIDAILRTVTIGNGFVYTETIPAGSNEDGLVTYGPFTIDPPDGISCLENRGAMHFTTDDRSIGGIVAYPIPEGVYDPSDETFFWLEEVGIPDFEDPSLCYMGGITSGDTGWAAEFASDVPEGMEPTVYRRHHFYPIDGVVYDIWFDMLLVDLNTSNEIRQSISFPIMMQPETATQDQSQEDIAFDTCLSVLDAVQNSSYHIAQEWKNDGGNAALNDSSYTNFYQHNGNLLSITEVPESGSSSIHGCLYVNDVYYDNQGNGWSEDAQPFWEEKEPLDDPFTPWLSRFVWVKSHVAYIDTMEDENGTCYMYRIDYKYKDREDYTDHYFVNFYFDPAGNFRYVNIQVNLFQANAFTVTESIVSLDEDAVCAVIDAEYHRAVELTKE